MPRPLLAVAVAALVLALAGAHGFRIEEASVDSIQLGFNNGSLTSVDLVRFYLDRISRLNRLLHAVIEVNPDALPQAARADAERCSGRHRRAIGALHGVPVLLKDNIATRDALNTTAGSFALLGSVVRRDAGVVRRLRRAGAVVLGKPARQTWTSGPTSAASPVAAGAPAAAGAGPICHTVADAVHVLDAIVGYDARDATPTMEASKYIPHGGYMQFLKKGGLGGKRIGVPSGFFNFPNGTVQQMAYAQHLNTMRKQGAVVIENLDIENLSVLLDSQNNGQQIALPAEFKLSLNSYLSNLLYSPVRSLAEIIAFNNAHPVEENMKENGQTVFLVAENTTGIGASEREATSQLNKLSANGLKKLMREHELDAIVTPNNAVSSVLAIDGMPAITVPAGYGKLGVPFGLCFGGLRGYELRLIEMAYAFEQVTMVRKTPTFLP